MVLQEWQHVTAFRSLDYLGPSTQPAALKQCKETIPGLQLP